MLGQAQISNLHGVGEKPLMQTKKYADIKGSPYLGDGEWFEGDIVLNNGKVTKNILIRYNAFEQNLEFRRNGTAMILEDRNVKGFSYIYNNVRGSNEHYVFSRVSEFGGFAEAEGFVRVLFRGEDFSILEKIYTDKITISSYGAADYQKFVIKTDYFIKKAGEDAVDFKLSKGAFKQVFPDKYKEIKSYIKDNNVDLNEVSDLQALCSRIETL